MSGTDDTIDTSRVGDGDLDLHAWFDVDGRDLFDDLRRGVQIDDALPDPHLEAIPGLGTLSARGFAGGDPQGLGGHADRTFHFQILLLGSLDEVGAHLLQGLDVPGGQGDADPMNDLVISSGGSLLVLKKKVKVRI